MIAVEALKLALTKEENAIKLYQELAKKHSQIAELLLDLSNEEHKHKKLIEAKIKELTQ